MDFGGAQVLEPFRDGPGEVVVGEVDVFELGGRRDGARYRSGEGVVGQVQLLEPPQRRERAVGDVAGEPVPGQVEGPERGQRGHVWERAREAVVGEAERAQAPERREQAQVRRGALQAEVLQLQHHDAAAGAPLHPVPPLRVAVAGQARIPLAELPRRAAVRPPQRRAERVQRVGLRLSLRRRRDEDERHRGQEQPPGGRAGHGIARERGRCDECARVNACGALAVLAAATCAGGGGGARAHGREQEREVGTGPRGGLVAS
jgi:hypothetical protein